MSIQNGFVFVVCGAKENILTLNFSIKYLKRFSKNQILVVTDTSRNTTKIEHDNIIDIKTPTHFDHHQASIFLKTRLHIIVDLSNNYCYLDSDVIALSPDVDNIFNYQYGPVTFAADHCKIDSFSPNAVNCICIEKKNNDKKKFIEVVKSIIPDYEHDAFYHNKKGRELYRVLVEMKENPLKNIRNILKYFFARYIFRKTTYFNNLGSGFKYNSKNSTWLDLDENIIMYNISSISNKVKAISDFSYNRIKMKWTNKKGENIFNTNCNHLIEEIKHKFNIEITNNFFQHWNGGVFLFNKNSVDFLETWHQHTLDIFNDKAWKTRDQGTLAATVWQYGLQNQKTLPSEFNFIADYYNPNITYQENKGYTQDNFKTIIKPNFIHIYHEFGNQNWEIWNAIETTYQNL